MSQFQIFLPKTLPQTFEYFTFLLRWITWPCQKRYQLVYRRTISIAASFTDIHSNYHIINNSDSGDSGKGGG